VEKAGQPESYTLWTKPDQDKAFAAFLRQNRVMSVHQETVGAKADYGSVGYTQDRHGSLLVFPKSLKSFEGKRIIGIKYDELKGATSADPEPYRAAPQKKSRKRRPPRKGPEEKKAALQKEPRPTKPAPAPKPKKEKPAPKAKKDEPAPPPPPNQIAFPRPEIVKREKPVAAKDPAEELARLKKAVRGALEALSRDKPVTAFNLLKSTIED
jgi:outer membrane biosynthesis protein TonB